MHRSLIRCVLEQADKKKILEKSRLWVESTYGDSHPGSGHLNILVEEVRKGIAEEGGFIARYNWVPISATVKEREQMESTDSLPAVR